MIRVVLDTNLLISALINPRGAPVSLLDAWRQARCELITSKEQLLELGAVARRPQLRPYTTPARVGRFITDLRLLARVLNRLPLVDRSPDPGDSLLLAMAHAGRADFLVTGDKCDALMSANHGDAQIVTARQLVTVLRS